LEEIFKKPEKVGTFSGLIVFLYIENFGNEKGAEPAPFSFQQSIE